MSVLYLYSLLDRPPRDGEVRGLRGERLRIVPADGFFVAAGVIAAAPRATARALRGHDAAVRRLAATVHAILPFRFGSLAPDERTLSALIEPRAAALRNALALVAGREQMTLRVSGEPADTLAASGSADPQESPDAAGPGTRYLRNRLRAHRAAHEVPEIDALRPALRAIVQAERLERHAATRRPLLASVYHLIPRGAAAAYLTAIQTRDRDLAGIHVAVSGPWPPYAFAPEPFA